MDGVAIKEFDYDSKTVTVMVEPGTETGSLVKALEDAGFGGSVD